MLIITSIPPDKIISLGETLFLAIVLDRIHLEAHAWEADDSIVILDFSYKDLADVYIYEMIHLSPCNNHRAPT